MKKGIYILLAAFMMLPAVVSAQQNLRTGYFLDGYIYKYKMNPAMAPERGFVAMPVLANLSVGAEGNLGLSTFLYPTETGLTTFLSPRVSNETFLDNISKRNRFNMNLDMTLFALGFSTGKAYHTVDISMRADARMNIPGDLLEFMKVGSALGNYSWDISNIGVRSSSHVEFAYGYSRSFLDEALRVGARAKLLMGAHRLDVAMDRMSLEMGEDRWAIESHGNMMMSAPVSFMTNENNKIDFLSFDTTDLVSKLMSPSMGFALDFGATYDFLDHFTASLSVLDLGAMSWKNTMTAATPETSWEFEGFESMDMDSIEEQVSGLMTDLTGAFSFEPHEKGLKKAVGLGATIHAGIEARMPFYDRLSFGMLYTQRIEKSYSWSEGRIAASVAPLDWFSATTNYAISNFGHSWGGAFNIHLPGFGLFVGFDSFAPLLNVTPQYIPVNSINTNLALGINFTFGKYTGRYPKKTATKKTVNKSVSSTTIYTSSSSSETKVTTETPEKTETAETTETTTIIETNTTVESVQE